MEQNNEYTADGGVMTYEQAEKEVNGWLDEKGVRPRKRKDSEDSIETLIEAVQDGDIYFDEDGNLIQKLSQKVGDQEELTYQSRITLKEVRVRLKNIKTNDIDGRVMAYIAAATKQPLGIIDEMSTNDYSLSQAVAVFFM